jgi:hypothetical protein
MRKKAANSTLPSRRGKTFRGDKVQRTKSSRSIRMHRIHKFSSELGDKPPLRAQP